jgi:lysophospholipase L1-like esterase
MSRPRLPLGKRVLFAGILTVLFLFLAEGALRVGPRVWLRITRGPERVGETTLVCIGDSVTHGDGVGVADSYPSQLRALLDARGAKDVGLLTHAEPGAEFAYLGSEYARSIAGSGRRVHLVLLGHNDVVRWPASQKNPFRNGPNPTAVTTSRAQPWEPRLLRVFSWAMGAVHRDVPIDKLDPALPAWISRRLGEYRAAVPKGDRIYLLTYAVPGTPPADMDSYRADVIRTSRALQLQGNEMLRRAAAENGVTVIDLERLLDFGSMWSAEWWQDDIHLTATGYTRMSREIYEELATRGEIRGG